MQATSKEKHSNLCAHRILGPVWIGPNLGGRGGEAQHGKHNSFGGWGGKVQRIRWNYSRNRRTMVLFSRIRFSMEHMSCLSAFNLEPSKNDENKSAPRMVNGRRWDSSYFSGKKVFMLYSLSCVQSTLQNCCVQFCTFFIYSMVTARNSNFGKRSRTLAPFDLFLSEDY